MGNYGEEGILLREGCPLHYWTSGPAGAPWIILFHGGQVDHTMFDPQLEMLAGRFQLLTFDARGHGESQPLAGELSYRSLGQDGLALLDAVGADQAIFIGHSMGGCAVQEVLFAHPQRVKAAVLIGAPCVTEELSTPMRTVGRILKFFTRVLPEKNLQKFMQGAANSFSVVQQVQDYIRTTTRRLSKSTFQQIARMVLQGYHAEPGYRVTCPLLMVYGDHDSAQMQKQIKAWAAREQNCRLEVVPDAGHNANQDNPPEFNRILEEYLSAIVP